MLTFPEGLTAPMSLPACPTCPFAPRPMLIDMNKVYRQTNLENLDQAFSVAERDLGVTRLLDPEGMCHFPPPLLPTTGTPLTPLPRRRGCPSARREVHHHLRLVPVRRYAPCAGRAGWGEG